MKAKLRFNHSSDYPEYEEIAEVISIDKSSKLTWYALKFTSKPGHTEICDFLAPQWFTEDEIILIEDRK